MDDKDIEGRIADAKLAVEGGKPVRSKPMPPRFALGPSEIAMLEEAIRYYREKEVDPGYQGPFEKMYTDEFVSMMGGGYADSVSTGTASVYLAIRALELPAGSHVLCSPITDPGTVASITMNGLVPKLVDAKPGVYNTGYDEVFSRVNNQVSAMVLVHSAGQACEIDRIAPEAKRRGIKVVEDSSQSHGALIMGRPIGTFGDIAAFSTMYRKNHMTGGSGGVVYSRNLDLYRNALAHADRGKPKWIEGFDDRNPEHFLFPALNWNNDELSCAIGIASLRRLPDTIRRRVSFISELAACMEEHDTMFSLMPWRPTDSPFYLPVFVDMKRARKSKIEIAEAVRAEGVPLNPHYRYVVAEWPWAKKCMADDFGTPVAVDNRNRSFALYLNENHGVEEAADIAAAFLKVDRALGVQPKVAKSIPIHAA